MHRANELEKVKIIAKKPLTVGDFKGLFVPVFSIFNDDADMSLNLEPVKIYAKHLKAKKMTGIIVNSIIGEGTTMGFAERKSSAEAWIKHGALNNLIVIVNIGGTAMPDVLENAAHAVEEQADAVACLPELYYKPKNLEQLIGYLKTVAKVCKYLPFFYYHCPAVTNVNFDMVEFSHIVIKAIPNFFGILYDSADLTMGVNCLDLKRAILLGSGAFLASGMMLGFEATFMGFLNVHPELGRDIFNAVKIGNYIKAQALQKKLNDILVQRNALPYINHVWALKAWFSLENKNILNVGFPRSYL